MVGRAVVGSSVVGGRVNRSTVGGMVGMVGLVGRTVGRTVGSTGGSTVGSSTVGSSMVGSMVGSMQKTHGIHTEFQLNQKARGQRRNKMPPLKTIDTARAKCESLHRRFRVAEARRNYERMAHFEMLMHEQKMVFCAEMARLEGVA